MERKIQIQKGFIHNHKTMLVDIFEAKTLLKNDQQLLFTKVSRKDNEINLTQDSIKCPYCGHEVLQYRHFLSRSNQILNVSEKQIENFLSEQISFFEPTIRSLSFNERDIKESYTCVKCGYVAPISEKYIDVNITDNKEVLFFSFEVGIKELLSLPWMPTKFSGISAPIEETVTFNLKSGNVIFSARDQITTFFTMELRTNSYYAIDSIPVTAFDLINKDIIIKRIIRKKFTKYWELTLPYSDVELNLEKFVLMTRYINYPRNFYDAIPFCYDSKQLDASFYKIAIQLHNGNDVPMLYTRLYLPDKKSVKKIVYENPGLMFYSTEINFLWKVVQNTDAFCKLLLSEPIYSLLSVLHIYPGIGQYYSECCIRKGSTNFVEMLINHSDILNYSAINYFAMSDFPKKLEQEKWGSMKTSEIIAEIGNYFSCAIKNIYSLPLHNIDESIRPCCIDGYIFKWLRNKNEYNAAAEELNNCLHMWDYQMNPVIVASKNGKVVASFEIKNKVILQAFLKNNKSIQYNSDINNVYKKWKKRFKLTTLFDDT
jgi:DNA-directed RNA polymerase subunit M/transcription elongation factor TFIIS